MWERPDVREKAAAAATAMNDVSPQHIHTHTEHRGAEKHTPQISTTSATVPAVAAAAHCKRQPLVTNGHRSAWLPGHNSDAAACSEIQERPRRRRKDRTGEGWDDKNNDGPIYEAVTGSACG
jgi:hypothetical protein